MGRAKVLAALLFAACAATARAQDQLVILSPHWEGIEHEFTRAFQEAYRRQTGRTVELKWLDVGGGTSSILRYIRSEFAARPEGTDLDVFFGGGVDPYIELKQLGLLAPFRLPDEALAQLAKDIHGSPLYDAEDYTWYAATMSGFGIIYNTRVLKEERLPVPRTWEDLARPEARNWVASADPRKSGSAHMAYEIILQAYGWEKGWQVIHALGANVRTFTEAAGDTPKDVALGEGAYGLCIDFYAWRQRAEPGGEIVEYVTPADLSVVNGDAIGILKGAPHMEVARAFVAFVMSEAGQKLWALRKGEPDGPQKYELGRFTVLPGLYPKIRERVAVRENPFEWKPTFRYDAALGSARWGLVNDLIGAMIIDPQRDLVKAWKAAIEAGRHEELLPRLAALPLTEEQARLVVKEVSAEEARRLPGATAEEAARLQGTVPWRDQPYRNRCLKDWSAFARDKYAGVLATVAGREPSAGAPSAQERSRAVRRLVVICIVVAAIAAIYVAARRRTSV